MIDILFLFCFYLNSQTQLITKDFDWKVKKTQHFDIYHYSGSEKWLDYVERIVEDAYLKGKKEYNPRLDKTIPFFFYTASKYFQQNTISETGEGTGGFTEPYKDRFVVYSDGSKRWLRYVIFHEFGHEIQFSVLVDGWWESPMILKTVFYPLWMLEGLSEDMTDEWDKAMEDMYVRDYFVDGKLPPLVKLHGFAHLKPHQITLGYKTGAKAIKFLKQEYGYDKAGLFLYYFRDSYDINTVLKKLIGSDIETFNRKFTEHLAFYFSSQIKENNMTEASNYGTQLTVDGDDIPVFNTSPLPLGKGKIAYISTYRGYPSIVLDDGKKRKIIDRGTSGLDWIVYSNFTLPKRYLFKSSDSRYIVFSGRKDHKDYICIYDSENDLLRKVEIKDVDEISQVSFSPDDKKIVFAAMKDSFYDIYEADFNKLKNSTVFTIGEAIKITDDNDYESSAQYISNDKIAFICEEEKDNKISNSICISEHGEKKKIFDLVDVSDFYYDRSKNIFYIISPDNGNYELYSYIPSDGSFYRHTSVVGGIFTPYSDNDGIYVSYFRHGSMHIFRFDEDKIDYKPVKKNYSLSDSFYSSFLLTETQKQVQKYKTKFSTDLFFPAFLYSSPGGFFIFNYLMFSDFISRHSFSIYSNINSASSSVDLRLNYLYNRYRTKFFTSLTVDNYTQDIEKPGYKKRFLYLSSGFIYPVDRNSQIYLILNTENDEKKYIYPYSYIYYNYRNKERGGSVIFSRDMIDGVYLTAVDGYALSVSLSSYGSIFGGNRYYNLFSSQYIKYIPISRKSTVANRVFAGISSGRDYPYYSYSGVGGVRGLMSSLAKSKNIALYNFELRLPVFYTDYYMYYIFPDFYFKSFYIKLFSDNSYRWGNYGIKDRFYSSWGFGFDVYTFILQTYRMVLSVDFSKNLNNGSDIVYFYIGPVF